MSWWLVGSASDLSVNLSHTGLWSLNGRPSPLDSQNDILHDQARGPEVARIRDARVRWHLSAEIGPVASDERYNRMVRERRDQSPNDTLAAAVFWPRPHGDDSLEFHLFPPPRVLDMVRPMFDRIIGRADMAYRIASALIKDRIVLPGDWPPTASLIEGRPHFTAGVEFSIFARSQLKH